MTASLTYRDEALRCKNPAHLLAGKDAQLTQ